MIYDAYYNRPSSNFLLNERFRKLDKDQGIEHERKQFYFYKNSYLSRRGVDLVLRRNSFFSEAVLCSSLEGDIPGNSAASLGKTAASPCCATGDRAPEDNSLSIIIAVIQVMRKYRICGKVENEGRSCG